MSGSKCPKCTTDLSRFDFSSSHSAVLCPRCGTDITEVVDVVDLRSESVRQAERDARVALKDEDEQLAQAVVILDSRLEWTRQATPQTAPVGLRKTVSGICDLNVTTSKAAKSELRRIGYHLCANGGDERMQRVGYRSIALGAIQHSLEYCWSGIGDWYNGYAWNFDF